MENENKKGKCDYGQVFYNRHGDPCLLPKPLVYEGILPDGMNSEEAEYLVNKWLFEGYIPGGVGSSTVLLYVRFEDGTIQMAATKCSDVEGLTVGQIQSIIEQGVGTAESVLEDLKRNVRDIYEFDDKVFLMGRGPYALLLPDGIVDSSKNTMLVMIDKSIYLNADWRGAFMDRNSSSVSYNLDLFNQNPDYRNAILWFCDEYKTEVVLYGTNGKVKRLSYGEIDKKPNNKAVGFIMSLLAILVIALFFCTNRLMFIPSKSTPVSFLRLGFFFVRGKVL